MRLDDLAGTGKLGVPKASHKLLESRACNRRMNTITLQYIVEAQAMIANAND